MEIKFNSSFEFACARKMGDFSGNREEWLLNRAKGIGGSDAGTILGVNKYSSKKDLWATKKGLKEGFKGNAATKEGNLKEPLIRNLFPYMFEDATGVRPEIFEPRFTFQSINKPFMIANVDGLMRHPELGDGVLEIKTANPEQWKYWVGENGEETVPPSYYAQVQHYMAVLDLDYGYIVCMINNKIIWRKVERNQEYIDNMIKEEEDFVQMLLSDEIPENYGYGDESATLLSIFKKNSGEITDNELAPIFAQANSLKQAIKDMEDQHEALVNILKSRIGDNKILHSGKYRGTWSKFEVARIDSERLREERPDIASEFTKKSVSSTFRITEV